MVFVYLEAMKGSGFYIIFGCFLCYCFLLLFFFDFIIRLLLMFFHNCFLVFIDQIHEQIRLLPDIQSLEEQCWIQYDQLVNRISQFHVSYLCYACMTMHQFLYEIQTIVVRVCNILFNQKEANVG